jgi:hypothetical protein
MSLNVCFFIDIVLNFTTAYYDGDYNLIHDHRVSSTDLILAYRPSRRIILTLGSLLT